MFTPKQICVELDDGYRIVAEINVDPDYKEVFVFLEDAEGVCVQDLAIVGEQYKIVHSGRVAPEHGKYRVLVYNDEYSEDYTHEFQVNRYEGERI